MNTRAIILGYPGIGKSSIGGKDGIIDLEVSNFRFFDGGPKINGWEKAYINFAVDIAKQGYIVLMGTHESTVNHFSMSQNFPVGIICPSAKLRDQWVDRLRKRCVKTGLYKDERAFDKAIESFDRDIWKLTHSGLPCLQLCSMDYDLRNEINDLIDMMEVSHGI